jgi:hypothetical protein
MLSTEKATTTAFPLPTSMLLLCTPEMRWDPGHLDRRGATSPPAVSGAGCKGITPSPTQALAKLSP